MKDGDGPINRPWRRLLPAITCPPDRVQAGCAPYDWLVHGPASSTPRYYLSPGQGAGVYEKVVGKQAKRWYPHL